MTHAARTACLHEAVEIADQRAIRRGPADVNIGEEGYKLLTVRPSRDSDQVRHPTVT